MRHWLEILFAFIACGIHAATPNLPLYVRPDGTTSGPSNFFTGSFIAGPNITLQNNRTNITITSMGSGATVTNIAGGTNISIRATGGTNFIDTTGELNNWSQIPTNTIPSTVASASNSLYLAIIANGSLVSNGCVAFTMTTSNTLASLLVASTNYHNLNGTNFTSKHATISSNLTVNGYANWGAGGDKMKSFLGTNGSGELIWKLEGEANDSFFNVDWTSTPVKGGSGTTTLNLKSSYGFFTNSIDVGALTISNNQTNWQGIWFTNIAMPLGGGSGITMYQNTNLLFTNGAAWILVNSNGNVGIGKIPNVSTLKSLDVSGSIAGGGVVLSGNSVFASGGLVNLATANNSRMVTGNSGSYIDRNIANSEVVLSIRQANSGAAGNLFSISNSSSEVLTVASNGFLRVNSGGGLNPVGAYGSLMMNATNIVVCAGAAGVYTNVAGTGFTTIVTNGFYGDIAGNSAALTNLVAGWYRVAINISMLGQGNQACEGELFTNGVACDLVGFKKTFDAAARMDSTGANGIIYLPAGTRADFRIQDAGTGGSISVHRASLVIGTP